MAKLAKSHHEAHRIDRIGWLRAAVLGANDGLISTSSLLMGVASADAQPATVMLTGLAALVAGALSMAAGEYVSVSSQADTEAADIAKEKQELVEMPEAELKELIFIYQRRGLSKELATQVAEAMTAHDALGAHLRDELGISEVHAAKPVQAALSSAAAFAVGALPPLFLVWVVKGAQLPVYLAGVTLVLLAALGAIAGNLGGASAVKGATRVMVWGSLAMAATWAIGRLFGVSAV
ncbi:VIT1/CCC1 transporter family protein [Lysobacter soyae]|uniref:VIT family protein n=1 Tax=Lysobacter soyae TaxID=2764185 RepID=A0ABX8WQK5_9GAMM|nr:VIT family protein [Lysobacter sp. CJ11]QYR53113.1 VIT family protein [Lysobacter sp. CJ11]